MEKEKLDALNNEYIAKFDKLHKGFSLMPEDQYKLMCEALQRQYEREYKLLDSEELETDEKIKELEIAREKALSEIELKKEKQARELKETEERELEAIALEADKCKQERENTRKLIFAEIEAEHDAKMRELELYRKQTQLEGERLENEFELEREKVLEDVKLRKDKFISDMVLKSEAQTADSDMLARIRKKQREILEAEATPGYYEKKRWQRKPRPNKALKLLWREADAQIEKYFNMRTDEVLEAEAEIYGTLSEEQTIAEQIKTVLPEPRGKRARKKWAEKVEALTKLLKYSVQHAETAQDGQEPEEAEETAAEDNERTDGEEKP